MRFELVDVRRRSARAARVAVLGLMVSAAVAAPGTAPSAVAATGTGALAVAMNAAGTQAVAIEAGGRVVDFYQSDGFWQGPAGTGGTARSDSPVATDASGTTIVFIDTSGNVAADTFSSGWHGPTAIGGTARAGSPIAISGDGTHVVFTDNAGHVVDDWLSGGAWQGPAEVGGTARVDSPVAVDETATRVMFIDTSGRVVNDWVSGGSWQGPAATGGTARAGSALAVSATARIVTFVNASGNVVNDWADSSGWHGPAAMGGKARADSPLALNSTPDHVFFVDTSGNVANDWVSGGTWQGPAGIGGTAHAGSSLATMAGDPSTVVFIDAGGNLVTDWGYGGGWHGPGTLDTITPNFHGVNWPSDHDNFSTGVVYVSGLSSADTYASASTVADQVVGLLYSITGANTVRMPINEATVSSYWGTYTGAIDEALTKGNVILAYWTPATSVGAPPDMTRFWTMWDTVVAKYRGNGRVFFEVINEPHGQTTTALDDMYDAWLSRYPAVGRAQVILDGANTASDASAVGGDSRLNGTRLAVHDYTWFNPPATDTEAAWSAHIAAEIGPYAGRTLATEWGDWMNRGIDYDTAQAGTTDVDYVRGITSELRKLGVGSVYWPGTSADDGFALTVRSGSGSAITLSLASQSGLDRLRYGWGM